jgi:hypothetical protein
MEPMPDSAAGIIAPTAHAGVLIIAAVTYGALASPVMDAIHRWEERRAARFSESDNEE